MIPPERLAEIERVVNAGDYPCAYCPDLLTALREAQTELDATSTVLQTYFPGRATTSPHDLAFLLGEQHDTLQQRVEVAEGVARFCDKERVEALQRRVEGLKKALSYFDDPCFSAAAYWLQRIADVAAHAVREPSCAAGRRDE